METKISLLHGQYYHIYNRGNNGIDVFLETENYYYFLRLYAKYIEPIADTFAWCLMRNHFHVLVRIKEKEEVIENNLTYTTTKKPKAIEPYRQFSHLFNAYTQAINKRHNRTGSLFETKFERKLVESERYFKELIFYIHNNPVHHNFVSNIDEYPWSSYGTVLSDKKTMLERDRVIAIFDDRENFKLYHNSNPALDAISNLIIDF